MLSWSDERKEFIRTCRRAFLLGMQVSTGGNLSRKVEEALFLVKPSGISLFDMKARHILVTDGLGHVLEGEGKPTKEFRSHLAIYQARQDVGAIVHYHPSYATSFAVRGQEIPLKTVHARRILKTLPMVRPAEEGGEKLAASLREVFASREVRAAVMSGHGIIAVGKGLKEAQNIAELVEETAKIAFISSRMRT
jgi:L-ribulose-5-phosphate 4-epimerase